MLEMLLDYLFNLNYTLIFQESAKNNLSLHFSCLFSNAFFTNLHDEIFYFYSYRMLCEVNNSCLVKKFNMLINLIISCLNTILLKAINQKILQYMFMLYILKTRFTFKFIHRQILFVYNQYPSTYYL